MKAMRIIQSAVCVFIVFLMTIPAPVLAQDADEAPPASYSREELAQMLAPVALYPDALLAQVLMASTYPLEVVEADRWLKQHPDLQGRSLDEALQDKSWDPSVLALCYYPTVLAQMSDNITQVAKLGNAFLAQQQEVMDMVQELRRKAEQQGNLKSADKLQVIEEHNTIIIQPATPEVIYVPDYDPFCAYGNWWYPSYPPYYWGPRPLGSCFSFYPPLYVGLDIWSWAFFDWPRFSVFIDFDRRHRFHRGRDRDHDRHHDGRRGRGAWHHEPEHRRGVAYTNRATARRFGQAPVQRRETGRHVRGYPDRPERERRTDEDVRRERQREAQPQPETRPGDRPGRERRERERVTSDDARREPQREATPQPESRPGDRPGRERRERERVTTEDVQRELQRGAPPRPETRPDLRPSPERRERETRPEVFAPPEGRTQERRRERQPMPSIRPMPRENAFSGANEGRAERQSSSRGRQSRESFRGSPGTIGQPREIAPDAGSSRPRGGDGGRGGGDRRGKGR